MLRRCRENELEGLQLCVFIGSWVRILQEICSDCRDGMTTSWKEISSLEELSGDCAPKRELDQGAHDRLEMTAMFQRSRWGLRQNWRPVGRSMLSQWEDRSLRGEASPATPYSWRTTRSCPSCTSMAATPSAKLFQKPGSVPKVSMRSIFFKPPSQALGRGTPMTEMPRRITTGRP